MEINYVFQINSFHRYKREQPLSANAQALWYELFGQFNAKRFPKEIAVSTTHLCSILGLSKDTVLRARKELSENHLILVERNGGGRAASVVKMVYFQKDCGKTCGKTVENVVDNQQADDSEGEHTAFCVANIDASCDAKNDADCTGDFASQISTQTATQKEVCVANIDANCSPYINLNPKTINERYKQPSTVYPSYPSEKRMDRQTEEAVSREAWEKAKGEVYAQLGDALFEADIDPDEGDDPICEAAELMTEIYSMQGGVITIGGVSYAADIVKERLRGLNARRIYDAIDQMKNAAEPIRNIRGYLLSCLFNAASTTNIRAESDYRRYREGR